MVPGIMEVLYETDVILVESLQSRFLDHSEAFMSISAVFDPRYAFLFHTPLLIHLHPPSGRWLMWVVVLNEWTNHLIKWIVQGERPYWWVHETQVYNATGISPPVLHQFPPTCETGPGCPSGHSQLTAAVWFVILDIFQKKNKDNRLVSQICWLVYVVLLATIALSRVFLAAHFPHQCLLGMFIGWTTASGLHHASNCNLSNYQYSAATAGMFTSALLVYQLLHAMGLDPTWSLSKAKSWCTNPEFIHLDTMPTYTMMRYCGWLLGMGIGINSQSFQNYVNLNTLAMRICCAVLSVGVCLISDTITLPKGNITLYHLLGFVLNTSLPFFMTAIVPNLVTCKWPLKAKEQ